MNVYEKLQAARVDLQQKAIPKSGQNKHAGYTYHELSDFLPYINQILNERKLCSVVSFTPEVATLTIINAEKPDETITFTSPMAEASLRGVQPIQNVGAVQTYQRRYLYMMALEIVEHDALDASAPDEKRNGRAKATAAQAEPNGKATQTKPADETEALEKGRRAYFAEAKQKLPPIFGEDGPRNYAVWMAEGMLGRPLGSFNDIPLDILRRLYTHVRKHDTGHLANELRMMEEERERTPDDVPTGEEVGTDYAGAHPGGKELEQGALV